MKWLTQFSDQELYSFLYYWIKMYNHFLNLDTYKSESVHFQYVKNPLSDYLQSSSKAKQVKYGYQGRPNVIVIYQHNSKEHSGITGFECNIKI